ncbi:hypothetical protein Tco_0169902 [Tanacetum coccineum]
MKSQDSKHTNRNSKASVQGYGKEVDVHMYRSMIGSLMYLTSSRPDIMFAVYLKGHPKLGLWYPKDSPFDLVAYTNSDYAGASLDRKSTTGGYQFLRNRLISWQCKKQTVVANSITEAEYVAASSCSKTINREVQLHALVDGKKIIITESIVRRDLQLEDAKGVDCLPNATIFEQLALMGPKTTAWNEFSSTMATAIICLATNQKFNFSKFIFESMVKNLDNMGKILMYPRKPKRKDTQIPQSSGPTKHVADEAVHKEKGDSLVRAATTSSSLEAEQESGNISKIRSKVTPNEAGSQGTTLGGGPRCQETMGDTIAQTMFENVSKLFNDLLLAKGNTVQSGEDRLKLDELMELCTNLQTRVLDLEQIKTSQGNEITSLKRRVRKLKKKGRSRTHKLKRLYKVGLTARVDSSKEEVLGEDASKQGRINDIDNDEYITLVNVQDDAEMFAVNTLVGDDVSAKQEVATKDVNLTVDEVTLAQALAALKSVKPKVKEPSVPVSAVIATTKVTAATTTTATIPTPRKGIDDIQAKIEADHELAQRLQVEEPDLVDVDDDQEADKIKELMEIVPDEEEVAIDAIPLATKSLSITAGEVTTVSTKLLLLEEVTTAEELMLLMKKLDVVDGLDGTEHGYQGRCLGEVVS